MTEYIKGRDRVVHAAHHPLVEVKRSFSTAVLGHLPLKNGQNNTTL